MASDEECDPVRTERPLSKLTQRQRRVNKFFKPNAHVYGPNRDSAGPSESSGDLLDTEHRLTYDLNLYNAVHKSGFAAVDGRSMGKLCLGLRKRK